MVQKIAQELIQKAVAKRVSDLYLLPRETSYHVYERVADTRHLVGEFDEATYAAVIAHFKFVAGMNVGEKRRSQQGACDYDYEVGKIALRLSTVGDYRGKESLVLRHRPDLLIIGEIRDKETARAVIRASLTGVTIFSTVHGKSIAGVYARMLELGVSSDELHHALQGIIYQRLIGGGGIVDVATKAYQTYAATGWNQQIDQLFEAGHITAGQAQTEKIILSSSA